VKTGRNDPCPCGSGQKYKRCCLRDGSDTPRPDPQQARDDLQATSFAALLRFANRPQFRDARIAAFERFVDDHGPDDPGDGEEPIDEDVHLKFSLFYLFDLRLPDFDLRLPDGRTIAETFLQHAGWIWTELGLERQA
jgi:hypothetical protein